MAGPAAQGLLGNPLIANLQPDQIQTLAQLQQQQAIGQALLGQGLQPIDTTGRQVGGVGYRVSPLEGTAKLLQAYLGNKLATGAMGQQAQLMSSMYGNAFGGQPQTATAAAPAQPGATDAGGVDAGGVDAGSGGSGPGVQSFPVSLNGQPSPQAIGAAMTGAAHAPQRVGPLTIPGYTPQESMQLYSMLGPDGYTKLLAARTAPTAATLAAQQGGFDPAAANQRAFLKDTYLAPTSGTGILRDPITKQPVAFNPAIPEGATPLFDASGNVAALQATPGAAGVTQTMAAARAAGEGSQLPYSGVDAQGNPLPVTNRTTAATGNVPLPLRNNNPGAVSPGGVVAQYPDMQTGLAKMDQNLASYANDPKVKTLGDAITKWVGSPPNAPAYVKDVSTRLGIPANTPIDLTNPAQRQAISTAIMLHENGPSAVFSGAQGGGGQPIYAAAPMGAQTSADTAARNQQDELSKKWTDLNAQNQQAQGVISNLQNIKTLAAKAITGPQSDRLAYANGLLSLAGSEKATDAATANDLLNKYSNQIVTRLSQGGMGTDAARSILQSAYPNAHMTAGAINEAADNLVGAQQMVQAKARVLAPFRSKNDASGYTSTELAFDQNADPRIFQYANIKDPATRKAFAQNLMQQDPTIVQKIQTLQSLGALK